MDKLTTPLIEGIDSQTMQGGSYIRQPDGTVARVEGVNLSEAEKAAAPELIKAHGEAMAAAARPAGSEIPGTLEATTVAAAKTAETLTPQSDEPAPATRGRRVASE